MNLIKRLDSSREAKVSAKTVRVIPNLRQREREKGRKEQEGEGEEKRGNGRKFLTLGPFNK